MQCSGFRLGCRVGVQLKVFTAFNLRFEEACSRGFGGDV